MPTSRFAIFVPLLTLVTCLAGSTAFAQDNARVENLVDDLAEPALEASENDAPGSWVWMPIPMFNPTLDAGLAFAALRLYKLDPDAPSSTSGFGGFGTSNGSWGGGLFTQNYLRGDRTRLTGGAGYADLNLDFWGIGNKAPDFTRAKINQKGTFAFGQALWRVRDHLYAGPRLRYLSLQSGLRFDKQTAGYQIPPGQLTQLTLELAAVGPGLKIEWDSRDDNWFPTSGQFAQLSVDTSRTSFGSDRNYELYNFEWSAYWQAGERDVLALNATACRASDQAPFWDICLIGASKNLRGFVAGRYRDHNMLTGQIEYRKQLGERWGAVLFGGLGKVAENFSGFNRENLRTGAGFGVRWLASQAHDVRLSVDLAWGDGDRAAYFYIGEAF